jgi:hypothetical protein
MTVSDEANSALSERATHRTGWTCEDGNGKQGLVPANYLKEV